MQNRTDTTRNVLVTPRRKENIGFTKVRMLTSKGRVNGQTIINVASNSSSGTGNKDKIVGIHEMIEIAGKIRMEP